MQRDFSIQFGSRDELEIARIEHWRAMTPNERLSEFFKLLDAWKGPNARRLERTCRLVDRSQS
jgi:hypothetical protein